jgi:L-glutamine-phosphate cytidylyltransferase
MDALILAAGRGTRLGQGCPKCLVEVDGRSLIDRQIDALRDVGVDRIAVVVGYRAAAVVAGLPGDVHVVENHRYATTNSLYSFMLARPASATDVLVFNGDVLAHPAVVHALASGMGSAIAYDSSSGDEDEQMKLEIRDGALVAMSKALPPERSCGENLGLLRLSPAAARATFDAAERLVAAGRHGDWLASAINVAATEHVMRCLDVSGLPWVEIDFPEDLARAHTTILPAIEDALVAVRAA